MLYFSATIGDGDYSSLSQSLTFAPGSGDGARICSSVAILSDNVTELEENFSIALNLVTAGESLSVGNNVTLVTLTDSDGMYKLELSFLPSLLYPHCFSRLLCNAHQGHCV